MIRPKKKKMAYFHFYVKKIRLVGQKFFLNFFKYFYPPALKARGVNCFTLVCLFFCPLKVS